MDRDLIIQLAGQTGRLLTVEENALQGGFGSAVLEIVSEEGQSGVRVVRLGIGDHFVEHASQQMQRSKCGIDAQGIIEAARAMIEGDGTEQELAS